MLATLKGHGYGESVEALKFVDLLNGAGGGKGVVLVSGGTDGKGFVWDVTTGRVRAELSHKVSRLCIPNLQYSISSSWGLDARDLGRCPCGHRQSRVVNKSTMSITNNRNQ